MKEYDFRKWLTEVKEYGYLTVATRVSNVLRVCKYEGDLDFLYQRDKCRDLLERLSYSELDKVLGRKPRHKVPIDGDEITGSATLKQAVKLYVEFKDGVLVKKVELPDTDFIIQNGVLISYRGYKENIRIPDNVIRIKDQVFSRNVKITQIYIPEGVESIGEFAFSECTSLEEVRIPNSLKTFTYNMFRGCSRIKRVIMPQRLQYYRFQMFANAPKIQFTYEKSGATPIVFEKDESEQEKALSLFNNDFEIKNGVLIKYKGSNTSVIISENVLQIGREAFAHTVIQEITFPKSVKVIENWAFSACSNLEKVVILGSLKSIGSYAFNGCPKLSQINLSDSIGSIGLRAFHDCESLPNSVLPQKFVSQGTEIFGEAFATRKCKAEKEEELRQKQLLEEKRKQAEAEERERERIKQEELRKKKQTKIKTTANSSPKTKDTVVSTEAPIIDDNMPHITEKSPTISVSPVVPLRTAPIAVPLTQENWDKFVLDALNGDKTSLTNFVSYSYGKDCVIDSLYLEYLQPLVDGVLNRVEVENKKIEFKKDAKGAKAFGEELEKFDRTQSDISSDIYNVRASLEELEQDTSWMDIDQWVSHFRDIARNDAKLKRIKELEDIAWQPYYARIDVKSGDYGREPFYIGEKGYTYNTTEIVSVWSEFGKHYRNRRETSFSVRGTEYQILLRRKFDVSRGKLLDMANEYDVTSNASEMNITDPFLLVILQRKKSEKQLSNIISSIQQKQNEIIEYDFRKNLIVQGCAGSGKTMILLHRLANIKYNSPEYDFNKVKIITPNENFNLFIDDLTANLGIEDIAKMSLGQYYSYLLACYHQEKLNGSADKARDIQKRENSKKQEEFSLPIDIREKIYSRSFYSTVKEKVEQLILDDLEREEEKKQELQRKLDAEKPYLSDKEIVKRMEEIHDFKIVRDLDYFLGEGEEGSKNFARGYVHRLLNDSISKDINWNMNYNCVLYVKLLVAFFYYGALTIYRDRLLCIDEAQDIALPHFELLKDINNNMARFNLYGDLNQRLQDNVNLTSWQAFNAIIEGGYFELNENYRNAKKIVEFYNGQLNFSDESFGVSSRMVTELNPIQARNILSLSAILENRTALIASNEEILKQYSNKYTVLGAVEKGKISLLTVRQAKGLEFDTVVVLDNGMSTNERYISYSRALSELFYVPDSIIVDSNTIHNSVEVNVEDVSTAAAIVLSKQEIHENLVKYLHSVSSEYKYESIYLSDLIMLALNTLPEDYKCDMETYGALEQFISSKISGMILEKIKKILNSSK